MKQTNKETDKENILKEILPYNIFSKSYDIISITKNDLITYNNKLFKLMKRNLNIYNILNDTNYSLNSLNIKMNYDNPTKSYYIVYYNKRIDENFDPNMLDTYKQNYFKAIKFIDDILINNEIQIFKDENYPRSIFVMKNNNLLLIYDNNITTFEISYENLWCY